MAIPIDTKQSGMFPVEKAEVEYAYRNQLDLCMEAYHAGEWWIIDRDVLRWFDFLGAMAYIEDGSPEIGRVLRVVPSSKVMMMEEDDRLAPKEYFGAVDHHNYDPAH